MSLTLPKNFVTQNKNVGAYQLLVNKWDAEEVNFRHSYYRKNVLKWRIFKTNRRQLITTEGRYFYNLTMYYVYQDNVKKVFVYYHNEGIEAIGRSKFHPTVVELAYHNWCLNNHPLSLGLGSKISHNLVKYWIKIKKVALPKIEHYYQLLAQDKQNIYLDADNAFTKYRDKKHVGKMQNRLLTLHLGYQKQHAKNRIIAKTTLILQSRMDDNKSTQINNLAFIKEKIYELINKFYGKKSFKINLSGDGAPWIKELANEMNAHLFLDLFHFKRRLFEVFGFSKNLHHANKLIFEKLTLINKMKPYAYLSKLLKTKDFTQFVIIIKYLWNYKLAQKMSSNGDKS